MIAIILIAIAAGCASALMFASIISGALISLLLFYLAPLPLMVAAGSSPNPGQRVFHEMVLGAPIAGFRFD